MKHTPGPWVSGLVILGPSKTRFKSDGRCICKIYLASRDSKALQEEQRANANLIAASPELLEQLETLLNALVNGCETSEDKEFLVNETRELIKKARGES